MDGIATNAHINYTDGAYANVKNLRDDLVWLGVCHVRDATPGASAPISSYAYLADSGIKFDFLPSNALACVHTVPVRHQTAPTSIEGMARLRFRRLMRLPSSDHGRYTLRAAV